jgi:hypothetical protein
MSQTVYVVQSGAYSNRYVVAVFSDEEKAKSYQKYIDSDNDIEEFQLDSEEEPDWFKNGYKSKEQADKIAADKFAQYRHEQLL